MNKTHWNSVRAQGSVPDDLLRNLLDEAYRLVLHALPKKKQREVTGSVKSYAQIYLQAPAE